MKYTISRVQFTVNNALPVSERHLLQSNLRRRYDAVCNMQMKHMSCSDSVLYTSDWTLYEHLIYLFEF